MSHNPGPGIRTTPSGNYVSIGGAGVGLSGSTSFPSGGGGIAYPQSKFTVPDQRSEAFKVETETEHLKAQIVQLEKRMTGLEAVVNDQEITIKNLCEIIDEFRRNFSGQRGHQKPSYWEER